MEKTNLLTLVVTLTVGIILAGSLLMPVITDATTTEKTFENGKLYYMTDLGEDSITYTFDGTKWIVDGEDANFVISDATTLIAGNDFIVRSNGQVRGSTTINPTNMEITVTASGVSGTYNSGANTISISADVYYCAVTEKTDYVLCPYNVPVYLHKDSEILADGQSGISSGNATVFRIEGSIDDGFTVTPVNSGVTVSDLVCNYEAVDGYIDLYKVNSITFKTTYNAEERTQTYSSYIVPASVTSELTNHLNNGEIALMNALPVIVIIGLVLAGVGAIFIRNRD